jgi:hypothetical protein
MNPAIRRGGAFVKLHIIRGPIGWGLRRLYAEFLIMKLWGWTRDRDLVRRARHLQHLSRAYFGWTTSHTVRWWEYSWVMRQVEGRLEGRVPTALDVGAGMSPIPLALSELGLSTIAADPDSQKQTGRYVGGEWSWTDYGAWGVRSVRAGIEDAVYKPGTLGIAVSVSVVEHVPARVRRHGLKQLAVELERGGLLVLTVDLVPGGRQLWNRVLGVEVEPLSTHGTVTDLIAEADSVGLRLDCQEACPIHGHETDVLGLVFRAASD